MILHRKLVKGCLECVHVLQLYLYIYKGFKYQKYSFSKSPEIQMTEAVKVMVRCRPMSTKQKQRGCQNIVQMDHSVNQVKIFKNDFKQPPKSFSYDFVFGSESLQSVVYEQTAFALVDNVLQGYNGTIFAYGQTGCGKTHTMMGIPQSQQHKGIIPRTFHQIVTLTNAEKDKKHLVQCSFIQIYNEQIHDLLGKDVKARMQLKQSPDKGVFVKDLSMNIVKTESEMQRFMDIGFKNRAVRQTAMNKQSSRSHSLFTIHIESEEADEMGDSKFKVGKLNLVDLAGSERQSKTGATGDGMKQAAKINLSLSALGNVISALVDGRTNHIPYRDSKLTRLLQDSLGGNTKTIMIAAISPADYNLDQTISTLRYASRAKFIKNKPTINQDPKDTLLRQYADEIKKLKMMLEGKMPLNSKQFSTDGKPETVYRQVIIERTNESGNSAQLQNELRSKEDQLRLQQQQKQKMKQQMQKLQKLISREDIQVDKRQIQKMSKMKDKLKQQKKKEEQYEKQKKKREEELLHLQSNYKSLNEQVEVMRSKFSKIKAKYVQNLSQLRDIQAEHEREKEELLDTIRSQQSQVSKFSNIVKMLLTNDQIEQILQQSSYNDQVREWTIIPFYYREKTINFPKLPGNQTKQLIQNQKQKKQIIFKDQSYNVKNMFRNNQSGINLAANGRASKQLKVESSASERITFGGNNAISKSKDSFKISQVVKNARESKQYKEKPDYSVNMKNSIDFDKYEKFDNKKSYSNNNLTSLNNITNNNNNGLKPPKNPQLTPIKIQSEQRIKLDEVNINSINNGGGTTYNKIKLNPIGGGTAKPPYHYN